MRHPQQGRKEEKKQNLTEEKVHEPPKPNHVWWDISRSLPARWHRGRGCPLAGGTLGAGQTRPCFH